jgi:hypothetical protein
MKIRIIKDCECCLGRLYQPLEDCTLKKGRILSGKVKPTVNWKDEPIPAIDLFTKTVRYFGIPCDSFEELNDE